MNDNEIDEQTIAAIITAIADLYFSKQLYVVQKPIHKFEVVEKEKNMWKDAFRMKTEIIWYKKKWRTADRFTSLII